MQKKIPGSPIKPTQTHTYKSSPSLPGNWMTKSPKYQKISPISFKSKPIVQIKSNKKRYSNGIGVGP